MSVSARLLVLVLAIAAQVLTPVLTGAATPVFAAEEVPVDAAPAVVETQAGQHSFRVEIADTPAERSKGLMDRPTLEADRGMLFDMGDSGPANFWMKNTLISLDIIFIREDGTVANVAQRTTPLSEALVPSDGPIRWVLELNGGTAERIGLKAGDRVRHPVIDAAARD